MEDARGKGARQLGKAKGDQELRYGKGVDARHLLAKGLLHSAPQYRYSILPETTSGLTRCNTVGPSFDQGMSLESISDPRRQTLRTPGWLKI